MHRAARLRGAGLIAHCIRRPLHLKRSKDLGVDDPRGLGLFRPHPGPVQVLAPEMSRIHAALFFAPGIGLHAMRDAHLTQPLARTFQLGRQSIAQHDTMIMRDAPPVLAEPLKVHI